MTMISPLILHAPPSGEGTPLPLGLAGFPTVIEQKPVHYRRKEIIRAGEWVHRGDRKAFSVSRDRMDTWAASFNRRLANGIRPFIPDHHTEEPKAGENFGYVVGLTRDGDSLYADLQLIGDDAIALAAKNDVSVYVKAEGVDAKGNAYGEHLHHIALTPNPNQPHLGPFVTIAASAAAPQVEAPVFELNATAEPVERSPIMKPETITKLRAKLNLPDAKAVPDDEVAERAAVLALADPPTDKSAEVVALSADVTRLTAELATEKAAKESATLALSAAQPKIDPEIMRDRAENYVGKIANMVDRGDIPKAIGDKIAARLSVAAPPVLMLSAAADFDNKRPIDFLLSLFDGAKLGIQTNNPVTRAVPALRLSGDNTDEPMTEERRQYVAQSMGITLPLSAPLLAKSV